MIDDGRLGKLLVQSGILSKESLDRLLEDQSRSKPPTSLYELVLARGLADEDRLRDVVRRADQYTATQVTSTRLGKFELRGELGRGGMGVVYRAWQPDLQRDVALKVIPANADPVFKERFLREARVASRLRHPNIVAVHEYGEAEGAAFFAMDCVDGESFDAAMKARPLAENVRILATVARALHHAHTQGLVHRDIKPQNILVGKDGTPYLTDFGLARETDVQSPLTVTGQIVGTPAFMSPEQARGGKAELGPASDLFSLGAVLYVVLTGQPPFRSDSVYGLLDAIIKAPAAPPRTMNSKVPPALEAVCLRCLEKEPSRRYASAEALAQDLERALAGGKVEASASPSATTMVEPGRRQPEKAAASLRRPLLLVAAGMAGALLVGNLIVRWTDPPLDPYPPAATVPPSIRVEPGAVLADASWFASPPKVGDGDWEWVYIFKDSRGARDWQVQPAQSRGSLQYEAKCVPNGLQLRNVEARFVAPLESEATVTVVFAEPPRGPNAGLFLAGYRVVRGPDLLTLITPADEIVTHKMGPAARGDSFVLEITRSDAIVRTAGQEVLRRPHRGPPQALRPALFAQTDTTAVFGTVEIKGVVQRDWPARHLRERREFEKVGGAYRVGPPQDLLLGGATGRFKNEGGGTPERVAGALRYRDIEDKAVELHGPSLRNSRLHLKYAYTGSALTVRFRAGYREIQIPLPCGGRESREIEIVALEHLFRCTADGVLDVESATANGTDQDHISLRLRAKGGELTVYEAKLEEILGIPPQDPWFMLFSGAVQGLELPATWSVVNRELTGTGDLTTVSSWPEFEAEVILRAQPGARLSFGAGGQKGLFEGEAVPMYGSEFSGFTFRVQGGLATFESDLLYARRPVPVAPGRFTLTVSGPPVRFFSIRLRSLK